VITISGALPNQQAIDRLTALVAGANTAGKPVQSTLTVNPAAAGGDTVRFIGLDPFPFPEGTPVIGPSHGAALDGIAATINSLPDVTVIVIGRSDQRGDEEHNLEISQRRAEALVNYLVRQGVDPARLYPLGIGEAQLTSEGDDEDSFALNRRAEFIFSGLGA